MANPLRHPIINHQKLPKPKKAQAALDAASMWLCQSGELLRIYQVWPDFTQRSQNLPKVLAERLTRFLADKSGQTRINMACHCHDQIVSIALQIENQGEPEPTADATIPLRLFWDERDLET